MESKLLKLVYFSPTGTTKSVIQAVAQGINQLPVQQIDITFPQNRKEALVAKETDLLVIGVPVYMGRVPDLIKGWLHLIEACHTPVVCIVVYGNRVYDDALLELKTILKNRGCVPVAGAAYIGEHSFSGPETPIAQARPDESDLHHATMFGQNISKMLSGSSLDPGFDLSVPGEFPYRGITELWNVDFISTDNGCTQCGICAEICPTGAVSTENSRIININSCITCCACIKNCPHNARSIKPGLVRDAAMRLNRFCSERKEPELFF